MPIYEYQCNGCGAQHEFIQKFSDRPKRKCPSCGKSRLRKLVSAAAFHLKGKGWYVTDFRDQKKPGDKDKPNSDGKSAESPDSKKSTTSSDSKDNAKSSTGKDTADKSKTSNSQTKT